MRFYTLNVNVLCRISKRQFKAALDMDIESLVDEVKQKLNEAVIEQEFVYDETELQEEIYNFLEESLSKFLGNLDNDLINDADRDTLSKETLKLLLESIPEILASEYLGNNTVDFVLPEGNREADNLYDKYTDIEEAFHETHSDKYVERLVEDFNSNYSFKINGIEIKDLMKTWTLSQALYFEIDDSFTYHEK